VHLLHIWGIEPLPASWRARHRPSSTRGTQPSRWLIS